MIAAGAIAVILLGGLLGDFATSALKRQLDVKDFPAIHGFHGGALDIHDAYLFALPSFTSITTGLSSKPYFSE